MKRVNLQPLFQSTLLGFFVLTLPFAVQGVAPPTATGYSFANTVPLSTGAQLQLDASQLQYLSGVLAIFSENDNTDAPLSEYVSLSWNSIVENVSFLIASLVTLSEYKLAELQLSGLKTKAVKIRFYDYGAVTWYELIPTSPTGQSVITPFHSSEVVPEAVLLTRGGQSHTLINAKVADRGQPDSLTDLYAKLKHLSLSDLPFSENQSNSYAQLQAGGTTFTLGPEGTQCMDGEGNGSQTGNPSRSQSEGTDGDDDSAVNQSGCWSCFWRCFRRGGQGGGNNDPSNAGQSELPTSIPQTLAQNLLQILADEGLIVTVAASMEQSNPTISSGLETWALSAEHEANTNITELSSLAIWQNLLEGLQTQNEGAAQAQQELNADNFLATMSQNEQTNLNQAVNAALHPQPPAAPQTGQAEFEPAQLEAGPQEGDEEDEGDFREEAGEGPYNHMEAGEEVDV